jgi:hypothetical protein
VGAEDCVDAASGCFLAVVAASLGLQQYLRDHHYVSGAKGFPISDPFDLLE